MDNTLADGVEYTEGMTLWTKAEIQSEPFQIGQFTYIGNGFLCYREIKKREDPLLDNQDRKRFFSSEENAKKDFVEHLSKYVSALSKVIEEVNNVPGKIALQWWRNMTDKQQETFLNMKGYGLILGMPRRSVSSLTTREVVQLYKKFLSERGIQ